MLRTLKKVGYTFICIFLLLPCVQVKALENHYDIWKKEALIEPNKGELVAAGPIDIKWKTLKDENVKDYIVYIDSYKTKTVKAVDQDVMNVEIYSTSVASHTVRIVAILEDNQRISSNIRTFYVSKKGIGSDMVKDTPLGLSWYYNWSSKPNQATSLEFVPMIWNEETHNDLKRLSQQGYETVLGYNEPDFDEQSNINVEKAILNQHFFTESGLRVGSAATLEWGSNSSWMDKYMNSVGDEIDFVAMHAYIGYIGNDVEAAAKGFLDTVEQTSKEYGKPVWISEFGVANWDPYWKYYSGVSEEGKQEVYQFMDLVINGDMSKGIIGLDKMDCVERYAWFPFDSTDDFGGASGLYNTKVDCERDSSLKYGELTELGKLYRNSGNPFEFKDGYIDQIPQDQYVKDIQSSQIVNVQFGTFELKEVQIGDLVERIENPSVEGYQFKGWYEDEQCTKAFDFTKPITHDLALYACFTKNIVHSSNTHQVKMGSQTYVVKDGKPIHMTQPNKDGYTFMGWYLDKEGLKKYDFSKPITKSITLYAKFKENQTSQTITTNQTNTRRTTKIIHTTKNAPEFIPIAIGCGVVVILSIGIFYITYKKRH